MISFYDLAENNNYMCGNQVYGPTIEIESTKMFIKKQFYVVRKALSSLETNRSNKTIKKL